VRALHVWKGSLARHLGVAEVALGGGRTRSHVVSLARL